MANIFRERVSRMKASAQEKRNLSGWVIPQEKTAFGDEGAWYVCPSTRFTWYIREKKKVNPVLSGRTLIAMSLPSNAGPGHIGL